jgi:hypothetical protein
MPRTHPRRLPRLLDLVRIGAIDPASMLTESEQLPAVIEAY